MPDLGNRRQKLPGGVDQPSVRFMPQAIKIAAPHIEPISAKNPPTKTLFNVPTPFIP